MSAALLPPNATALERAAADAIGARAEMDVPLRSLWDPETCPEAALPWLAWALSVDVWDPAWPESVKRRVTAEALALHRIKGSRAAVERAIRAMGLGELAVVEGHGAVLHDGVHDHDGAQSYGEGGHWAEYRVYLTRPVTNRQADQVRAALAAVAPARCRLAALNFQVAALLHDGAADHDGAYNYGIA